MGLSPVGGRCRPGMRQAVAASCTARIDSGDFSTTVRFMGWQLGDWDKPDLSYAKEYARSHCESWDRYVPHPALVPCGAEMKPAMFFKIGYLEFRDWAYEVEATQFGWNWYRTKGEAAYVVLDFFVLFLNPSGRHLGIGGAGQVTTTLAESVPHQHKLRSRALIDPADPAQLSAIQAWAADPASNLMFFVEEHLQGFSYQNPGFDPETKRDLLDVVLEAEREVATPGIVPGSFPQAAALLQEKGLPLLSYWVY
jgi:hypothetical protein